MDFRIENDKERARYELVAAWREFFRLTCTAPEEFPLMEFCDWRPALLLVNSGLDRIQAKASRVASMKNWKAYPSSMTLGFWPRIDSPWYCWGLFYSWTLILLCKRAANWNHCDSVMSVLRMTGTRHEPPQEGGMKPVGTGGHLLQRADRPDGSICKASPVEAGVKQPLWPLQPLYNVVAWSDKNYMSGVQRYDRKW